jgi:Flp pilus assembly protein CpaB
MASETVLENVRVLAIDQVLNDQSGEPTLGKNTTIEVTPKQAEVVAVASDLGKLSLSLRSLARPVRARTHSIHLKQSMNRLSLGAVKPTPGTAMPVACWLPGMLRVRAVAVAVEVTKWSSFMAARRKKSASEAGNE